MCGKVHQKKECVGKNKMREEMLVDKEKRGEERGALVKGKEGGCVYEGEGRGKQGGYLGI